MALKYFKYYARWKESLSPGHNSISDQLPWITFPVIDRLSLYLNSASRIFEYGGGGSTIFFLNRAAEVVTAEHDPIWFETLQNTVLARRYTNWSGILLLPENDPDAENYSAAEPSHFYTADEKFKMMRFHSYVTSIDTYPDKYFDIVLVDGRSRPSCIIRSLNKVKRGGLMVIDNSDRSYYFSHTRNQLLKDFSPVFNATAPCPFLPFFSRTSIWQRKNK